MFGVLAIAMCLAGCSASRHQHIFDPVPVEGLSSGGSLTNASKCRLAIGDMVVFKIQGSKPENSIPPIEEHINEDGNINLPRLGPIKAAGKIPGELLEEIRAVYARHGYSVPPGKPVQPFEQAFFVSGQVRATGRIPYTGEITVTKAIQIAGGFTDLADQRKVRLTRADQTAQIINFKNIEKDPSLDVAVFPGDQIFVPNSKPSRLWRTRFE